MHISIHLYNDVTSGESNHASDLLTRIFRIPGFNTSLEKV